MKYYGNREIELLAPAGNFEILEGIVDTRCDAVYFGGQSLNMRMIRKGFNFSDEELKRAIDLCHEKGKKAYITVNNLIDVSELDEAKRFLTYLESIKPDALIVQDFAVIELIRQMGLTLEIHSSVMMNVHSAKMIEALKRHQIKRVVVSREMPLYEVKSIKEKVDIEIEYFTHGDMCIAHGAQCYYSSMLFGMSSNRGKCLKPCRWWFGDNADDRQFPLAVKDMCMYPHLREMVEAGVTSFKIEGRMREKAFICQLIEWYADAFERMIEDPIGFDRLKDYEAIVESRKRDLSPAYAFGKPGASNINTRYEGTGKIFSTGRMFSTPTPERQIERSVLEKVDALSQGVPEVTKTRKLAIKVNHPDMAIALIDLGYDRIYIAGEVFRIDKPISLVSIKRLKEAIEASAYPKTQVYIGTPRMTTDEELFSYRLWLEKCVGIIDGITVGNLGALEAFKDLGLDIAGDYSMNVYNHLAEAFYVNEGIKSVTASLELKAKELFDLLDKGKQVEVVVYGRIPVMYFEHDFQSLAGKEDSEVFTLQNEAGQFNIYKDYNNRTTLLSTHHYNLLPVVSKLNAKWLRYEAQTDSLDTIIEKTRQIKNALEGQVIITENETMGAFIFE